MQASTIEPTIDPEFRALIPALSAEERAGLEASLLAEGCRDWLVVWKGHGVLLDGHERLPICLKHGIEYRLVEVECADRGAAIEWIGRSGQAADRSPSWTRS